MSKKASRYCRFNGCKNTSNSNDVHFYRFPKDEQRCKAWIKTCQNEKLIGIPASKLHAGAHLCMDHFENWCFMNALTKHRLVHNAVPSCTKFQIIKDLVSHDSTNLKGTSVSYNDNVHQSPSVLQQLLTSVQISSTISEKVQNLNSSCISSQKVSILSPPPLHEPSPNYACPLDSSPVPLTTNICSTRTSNRFSRKYTPRKLTARTKLASKVKKHQDLVKTLKMGEARTSMVDIQVNPNMLKDQGQRFDALQKLEEILQQWELKKRYENTFGENHIVILNNDSGSLTATVKTYPIGVIALTFEHTLEETSVTNSKLEDMRKLIINNLNAKSETIPTIKRGSAVPVYFTSSDERILEYDFNKVLYYADSPYQNIKILHSPTLGNCLILDDLQNLADSDISYTQGVMKHGAISYNGKDVLILGGGDGGLLHELLKENPKFVTMVDIYQMVVDACREHLRGCCGDSLDKLEGPNYKVIIDDCLKMLDEYKNEGRKFDVIINDLTDIPIATTPQGELWDFLRKILIKSMSVLKNDGSYLNHAIGEGCVDALKNYENVLANLPDKVKFDKHIAFVPSFMENWVFYEVKKV